MFIIDIDLPEHVSKYTLSNNSNNPETAQKINTVLTLQLNYNKSTLHFAAVENVRIQRHQIAGPQQLLILVYVLYSVSV